jgi:hypothetical protein
MHKYLLDAGGAGLVFGIMIIFMIIAVVAEALVMIIMKYNKGGKAFLDSFLANLASLIAGYILLLLPGSSLYFFDSEVLNWLVLYGGTVVVEFVVLWLLNRKHSAGKTWLVSIVMNIVTYGVLLLYTAYS